MLNDDDDDDDGYGDGVLLEGGVYSPRQAILRYLARGLATLAEVRSLFLIRRCCCRRLIIIVDGTVVIRCVCGAAFSFAHSGVIGEACRCLVRIILMSL